MVLLSVFLITSIQAQSVAFMKMTEPDGSSGYLNKAIVEGLKGAGINAKMFSNYQLFNGYNNAGSSLTPDQIANLKMFNHDFVILHKAEITKQNYMSICYSTTGLVNNKNWQSEFIVFNDAQILSSRSCKHS